MARARISSNKKLYRTNLVQVLFDNDSLKQLQLIADKKQQQIGPFVRKIVLDYLSIYNLSLTSNTPINQLITLSVEAENLVKKLKQMVLVAQAIVGNA